MNRLAAIALSGLAGCGPGVPQAEDFVPDYLGAQAVALRPDLVEIRAAMTKARRPRNVEDYARCAVAAYALEKGYGFARHLRTNLAQEGGVWRADAVYTLSPTLPRGVRTIDAEVVAAACAQSGIPTV